MTVEMDPMVVTASHWPKPPKPTKQGLNRFYGKFDYDELSGGYVRILGDWVQDNIVTVPVKVRYPKGKTKTRKVQIHRKLAQMFEELMAEVFHQCKGYPITQIGGFCSRHKMHNPARSLSIHSWGAAVDFNWATNPVSRKLITDFPKELIEIFEGAGWNWGGRWSKTKDAMHFQFTDGA